MQYRPGHPGDLLISRTSTLELVGAVVIVAQIPPNLFLSDKVLRLETDDVDKQWLMWFLRSPAGRHAIEESATGNQQNVATGDMEPTTLKGFIEAARALGYTVGDEKEFPAGTTGTRICLGLGAYDRGLK